MKKKNKSERQVLSKFEKYLYEEIGIEFKACLYFYVILLFYCVYRWVVGIRDASIVHMAEMIFVTYIMGYVQIYLMSGVDDVEHLGLKDFLQMILCSGIYTGVSYAAGWLDRRLPITIGFLAYMLFAYLCAFWVYKIRRNIDEKLLNQDLAAFQAREKQDELLD